MSWRWWDEDWGSAGGQCSWGSDPYAVLLALKGDQESLLLEGLPGTPQPHRLPLAGTTFQLRQGPDQTQSLEGLGPINTSLIVMVTIVGARCRKTAASLWGLELGFHLMASSPTPGTGPDRAGCPPLPLQRAHCPRRAASLLLALCALDQVLSPVCRR